MTEEYRLDTDPFTSKEAVWTLLGMAISGLMMVVGPLLFSQGAWVALLFVPGFVVFLMLLVLVLSKAPLLFTRKKIRASLVLKTSSETYRPGESITLSVTLVAEEDFIVREAKVQFGFTEPTEGGGWMLMKEVLYLTEQQVSHGQSLSASFEFQLPASRPSFYDSPLRNWDMRVLLKTVPRIYWGIDDYRQISVAVKS